MNNSRDIGETLQITIMALLLTAGIIFGVYAAIPIKEHNTVTYVSWTWDIPVYKYTQHSDKSWDRTPRGAYNVRTKKEYRKTVTKKDAKGNTYTEKVYDTRFYYNIDKWDFSYNISSTGIDKKPHESSAGDIPYNIDDPKLGDIKRGNHTEKYECCINGEMYQISKEDWGRVEKGCDITYKRHRFSKKIYDIQFGNLLDD